MCSYKLSPTVITFFHIIEWMHRRAICTTTMRTFILIVLHNTPIKLKKSIGGYTSIPLSNQGFIVHCSELSAYQIRMCNFQSMFHPVFPSTYQSDMYLKEYRYCHTLHESNQIRCDSFQ